MSKAVDYDDLSKPVTDFFVKLFPANESVKISTETKSNDGVLLKSTTTRKVDDKGVASHDCIIEPKFEFFQGYALDGKFQTNNNTGSLTVSNKDSFLKGLKVSLEGTQTIPGGSVKQTVTPGLVFENPTVYFKSNFALPIEEDSTRPSQVTGNVVIKPVDNVFLGLKVTATLPKSAPKSDTNTEPKKEGTKLDFEGKLAGKVGETSGHVLGLYQAAGKRELGVFVNHPLKDATTVGANFTYGWVQAAEEKKPETKEGEGKQPEVKKSAGVFKLQVAAQHKLSKQSTTGGSLTFIPNLSESKDPLKIRAGFGFSHFLNENVNATLGADVNISKFLFSKDQSQVGPGHSLGLELKFK
jgi:uncharacterized membrane protein